MPEVDEKPKTQQQNTTHQHYSYNPTIHNSSKHHYMIFRDCKDKSKLKLGLWIAIITLIVGILSLLIGALSNHSMWTEANNANNLSENTNNISREANQISREANHISGEATQISKKQYEINCNDMMTSNLNTLEKYLYSQKDKMDIGICTLENISLARKYYDLAQDVFLTQEIFISSNFTVDGHRMHIPEVLNCTNSPTGEKKMCVIEILIDKSRSYAKCKSYDYYKLRGITGFISSGSSSRPTLMLIIILLVVIMSTAMVLRISWQKKHSNGRYIYRDINGSIKTRYHFEPHKTIERKKKN